MNGLMVNVRDMKQNGHGFKSKKARVAISNPPPICLPYSYQKIVLKNMSSYYEVFLCFYAF